MDIENIKATLIDGIGTSCFMDEDPEQTDWSDKVGVLISANQAQFILDLIKENEQLKFQLEQSKID
jgi:hypothetical protein